MMNLFENLQTMQEAELRTMSDKDSYVWQNGSTFSDGSKPLISEGEYGTMIIAPSEDDDEMIITSIYYGPDKDQWAWKSYIDKESAVKDGKILSKLLDDEIDTNQLKRFGFELA